MRWWIERVTDAAVVAVMVAAGAVAAVAPVLGSGLVLGGYACGGAGNEQRCTDIARRLSLVEVSPRAWGWVVGGAFCVVLSAAALALARPGAARIALLLAVLALAFVGLVQTSRIDAKLGPSDGGGTYGRSIEDWGAFLSPALRDTRQDAVRRYGGKETEPGGPRYDDILDSFFVSERDGWRFLRLAVVVAFFAAGFATVRCFVRRPFLALVTTATAGLVVWGEVLGRAQVCDPAQGDCYSALPMILAVAASAIVWGVYFAGLLVRRGLDRAGWHPGR